MGLHRRYKDYIIDAQPYSLRAGGWSYELLLHKGDSDGVVTTIFFGNHLFANEEDAIRNAFGVARMKIDSGFVPEPIMQ